ncbi:hypothetical protein [Caldivirga maquilingensis]|uniref:DUF8196 domain-containing protein n=1 Tax=Caldivirga maquilingensis (strain ATCC 700844 / DSM 13496 / JCM 10307 / IC-167) TaxID=397948 RepID=A8MCE0_CALMQ|nr:hypothetical protein [Caldivirga maquilingensis]ABW01446.1 conserved hypothetical protein [Caldivirga maquilingensis IC-167]
MSFRDEFLRLLREDAGFRGEVMRLLGISDVNASLARLIESVNALTNAVNTLIKEETETRSEIKTLQEGQNKLWEAVKNLQEQVKALQEGQNKLWEEVRNLQGQVKTLQEQVKALQEGQNKLWEEVKALREEQNRLWEEVKALREGQNKLWEVVKNLQEGQNKLWEEVKALREVEQRHEEELKALREENNKIWQEIKAIKEENNKIWQEIKALREGQDKIWREIRGIKAMQERMSISLEEEANDVVQYYLKQRGLIIVTSPIHFNTRYEFDIYGTNGQLTIIGEAKVRAGPKTIQRLVSRIEELGRIMPDKLPGRVIKVLYCMRIIPNAIEEAKKNDVWLLESGKERYAPSSLS